MIIAARCQGKVATTGNVDWSEQSLDDRIFAVVAVSNEAPVVRDPVDGLLAALDNVNVVNSGSKNETLALLQGIEATILSHILNLRRGAALQTGIFRAAH